MSEGTKQAFALRNCVRAVRQHRHMTQTALAAKVGISRQSIVAIESGKYIPRVTVALRIAEVLKVPVISLFW